MKNKLIFLQFFILINSNVLSQNLYFTYRGELCPDSLEITQQPGIKYINKTFMKNFAILIQDTCLPLNRFTKSEFYDNKEFYEKSYILPAIRIDPENISKFEFIINEWLDTTSAGEKFRHLKSNKLKKYIRLYLGASESENINYYIIQFLTKKEFKKHPFYLYSINLLAQRRRNDKLKYIILKEENGLLSINAYYL